MSAPEHVRIVRIDPYHKVYGLLVPMLAQKILESLTALGDEQGSIGPSFLARLWAKDENVLLLAAVDAAGLPKGFTAAAITNGEFLLLQPRMEGPTKNDAVREMIEGVETWAKARGFLSMQLVSKRDDPKWRQKYGFEIKRYIWEKEIV